MGQAGGRQDDDDDDGIIDTVCIPYPLSVFGLLGVGGVNENGYSSLVQEQQSLRQGWLRKR